MSWLILKMKQVIIVRKDLKLPKCKMAAQVAHASLEAALKTDRKILDKWRAEGGKKIVLEVSDEKELKKYMALCRDGGLKTALITDAGYTVLQPGTVTCLGIGPDDDTKIDEFTGKLKML